MSYSALVTKTNRIARILAGSKKKICTKKPRFMSACAQLIIASLLILLQLGIIVALFLMEPPQVGCAHCVCPLCVCVCVCLQYVHADTVSRIPLELSLRTPGPYSH
ncbi:unnamed protein product [Oncorhynchus mykiss]|uniref:G-protein coupled receptors family 3 profile domain-containing protein n=1 Tax=Oncorhynchus mykiss TaxID=8022 RepID=A0A060ZXT3_ONCMY|nr:unnamed protein product [Oncorhynchus mykiss]